MSEDEKVQQAQQPQQADPGESVSEEEAREGAGAALGRSLRMAFVMVFVVLAVLAVWVWISSGGDGSLPFGYAGFD